MNAEEFLGCWRGLVRQWVEVRHHAGASHALLRDALETGLASPTEFEDGLDRPAPDRVDDEAALDCEISVLRLSGLIDELGYVENILSHARRPDAVAHFCTSGWKNLVNPSLDFDVWWYWFSNLGLDENRVNPLLHYALVGRHAGLTPIQPHSAMTTRAVLPSDRPIRRACLFAAFDVDGIVDDYVVYYLRELSRHCDVFYLADSFLGEGELAKLSDVTVAAWSIPHGRYDFGSYAMLAQDLVGWERLDGYDEVVLANDSCYALTGFDHVFARMDGRACDWWGLQASKADFAIGRGNRAPIPIEEAKATLMGRPEWRQMRHLHISSYFVALRRPAFQDDGFRRLVAQIGEQPRKTSIILKYEIGLSRQLTGSGHDFDTYIDKLYPFHPVYNADTFTLIADGFPLLKRTFLVENSTKTPDLAEWKNRILDLVPDAPVEMIERNLERVAPQDQLALSFSVVTAADGEIEAPKLLNLRQFKREDRTTPTFEHWWAFPVSLANHQLSTDARAVFEEVRADPSIKKVILTRSRPTTLTGTNTVVVPLNSPEGQHYVLRAGRLLVSDPPAAAFPLPFSSPAHVFVDIGGAGFAAPRNEGRHRPAARARPTHTPSLPMVKVVSSRLGSLLDPSPDSFEGPKILRAGFPRADFIARAEERLPADLLTQVGSLRDELGGRRLVIFASTYAVGSTRNRPEATDEQVELLRDWLQRNDAVLGVRENPADRSRAYAHILAPLDPIDLSIRTYPHIEVLYRLADAMISEYAPGVFDFLLTGKPVVVFDTQDDVDRPTNGLHAELERVMPSALCRGFADLPKVVEDVLSETDAVQRARYSWCRDLFFEFEDDHNAWRVVHGLRSMTESPQWQPERLAANPG